MIDRELDPNDPVPSEPVPHWSADGNALGAVAAPVPPSAQLEPAPSPLLTRLFKIAEGYRSAGNLRQGLEIYFELAEDYPETCEGRRARTALLEIGDWYERNREFRQARGLYERLL